MVGQARSQTEQLQHVCMQENDMRVQVEEAEQRLQEEVARLERDLSDQRNHFTEVAGHEARLQDELERAKQTGQYWEGSFKELESHFINEK